MTTGNFMVLLIAPVSALLIGAAALWLTRNKPRHPHGPAE